jgi:hypothetical protein
MLKGGADQIPTIRLCGAGEGLAVGESDSAKTAGVNIQQNRRIRAAFVIR